MPAQADRTPSAPASRFPLLRLGDRDVTSRGKLEFQREGILAEKGADSIGIGQGTGCILIEPPAEFVGHEPSAVVRQPSLR